MPRVKGAKIHSKRRTNILKKAKGYRWGRKSKIKLAKIAVYKAGQHAYNDRKIKKRNNRRLWLVKINAAVRNFGMSYSQFIGLLKKNNVELDRKILSQIAQREPEIFAKIVEKIK